MDNFGFNRKLSEIKDDAQVNCYICRYPSGHLIPNSFGHDWIIGIKSAKTGLIAFLKFHFWPFITLIDLNLHQ